VPELPDIEGFRRLVEARASSTRIIEVEVTNATVVRGLAPVELARALGDRTIERARRHGKWLFVETDDPTLVMHFGMTGALRWQAVAEPSLSSDRVVIVTSRGRLVFSDRRNLGTVTVAARHTPTEVVTGPLGPDALQIGRADLVTAMRSSRSTAKATLLDQSVVAGLGNMLTDEILWRACLDPARPSRSLCDADVAILHRAMRRVLHDAVRVGHIPRGPTWLSGARTDSSPTCPRCRAPLESRRLGGRTSFSCPHCQPHTRPDS
jgi:formamidopyrimidine-DNA glycosylase